MADSIGSILDLEAIQHIRLQARASSFAFQVANSHTRFMLLQEPTRKCILCHSLYTQEEKTCLGMIIIDRGSKIDEPPLLSRAHRSLQQAIISKQTNSKQVDPPLFDDHSVNRLFATTVEF